VSNAVRITWTGRVRPEQAEKYLAMHADPPADLIAAMRAAHLDDYRIHRQGHVLFTTFTYTGDDWDADMAVFREIPICIEWGGLMIPMLEPMDDTGEVWVPAAPVFDLADW